VGLITGILHLVVLVFFLVLLVRLVLDWVQMFARDWKPSGVALVVAEVTYTVTDPPLRALRRVLPPVALGAVRLDVAFFVLFVACSILLSVIP
jgi:YggT family protein